MIKTIKNKFQKKFTKILLTSLILGIAFLDANYSQAAQITSYRAVFKRIQASTAADGITITFATPTGIQTGGSDTITFTFSGGTLAAEAAANFDIGLGDSSNCTTATYTDEIVALTPSATDWGVDVTGSVITLSPETDDTLTAGFCMKLEIGTDATTGGTGSASTFTNPTAGTLTIAIAGAIGDTGTAAVPIITDDTVTITATVDPTISFSLSDTTTSFGTLSSAAARWADDTPPNASAVAAHNFQIGTNAASGYIVTYNGTTLTKGADKIDAAVIAGDADGTQNSEQFAMSLNRTTGDGTTVSAYAFGSNNYSFVENTTTQIYSETGPTATETVDVYYLANIASNTPAGSYQADVTFVATGTF